MSVIIFASFKLQIQNEGYLLQLGAKDALLNALLLAVKRFSTGPPQVHCFSFFVILLSVDYLFQVRYYVDA